jgi:hypothetical protein
MGIRGELFSTKIILPNRTYFFNVKENRMGDIYLNIVESKNRETGGFERQSVILFADDLQEFLKGFDESLKVMEKTVRDKRHSPGRDEKTYRREKPGRDEKEKENFSAEKKGRHERDRNRQYSAGDKHPKNFKTDRSHAHKPEGGRHEGNKRDSGRREGGKHEGGRRVVVKKKFNQ